VHDGGVGGIDDPAASPRVGYVLGIASEARERRR